ncbi:MAG: CvpA family protein [Acutalibacteraceae bacterium]
MDSYIPIIIDAAVILIVAAFVWIQAKRGFVRTIIEVVGCIAAALIAFSAAGYLSNLVFDSTMRKGIVESVDQSIAENGSDSAAKAAEQIWDGLPAFVTGVAEHGGLDKAELARRIDKAVEGGSRDLGRIIADDLIKPIVTALMSFVFAIILFSVLMILVRKLALWVNKAFRLPVLGTMNKVLGGVLGFFKGCIIVFALTMLISLLMAVMNNDLGVFTPERIDATRIFKTLYALSPFTKIS